MAERADQVVEEVQASGGAAQPAVFDVTSWDAVQAAIDGVGGVDILVNNAGNAGGDGWSGMVPFAETDPSSWERYIRINLYGVMNCIRAALPAMIDKRQGRIVTIVSDSGRAGDANLGAYAAAKAGAAGLTARGSEVGRHGITVNCVSLATIRPSSDVPDAELMRTDPMLKRRLSEYVIRRRGEPEDVAAMVVAPREPGRIMDHRPDLSSQRRLHLLAVSARPLPLLTPTNEFYWTSGADGRLRFQKCGDCAGLIHPPKPSCPYCHSDELGVTEVSGKGRLAGFTQNFQQWSPAFPVPYLVGIVVIDEDPRVHLTTNVVNADVSALEIGVPVQVVFEQVDDCWLPLFEPTGEPAAADAFGDPPNRGRQLPGLPADAAGGQVRGQGGDHRHRCVAPGSQADGRSVGTGGGGMPKGGRGRRADLRRHRRAVDLSG